MSSRIWGIGSYLNTKNPLSFHFVVFHICGMRVRRALPFHGFKMRLVKPGSPAERMNQVLPRAAYNRDGMYVVHMLQRAGQEALSATALASFFQHPFRWARRHQNFFQT